MADAKATPGPTDLTRNSVDVNDGTTARMADVPDAGAAPATALAAATDGGVPATPKKAAEIDYDAIYRHLADPDVEGKVAYMYQDTVGIVTVGVGNALESVDDAEKLPFLNADTSKNATKDEIDTAYKAVKALAKSLSPSKYKQKPSIELTDDAIKNLAVTRLKAEFIPGIKTLFPRFDSYPPSAQLALVDMAYNLGIGDKDKKTGLAAYQKLIESAEKGDWATAATQCHRKGIQDSRNDWAKTTFEAAAKEAAPTAAAPDAGASAVPKP